MTIQGARDELINMMECKDIPFYFVPILQKVVETIEMEIMTGCDIDAIRAEIEEIEISGQIDEHTMFIRSGEQVKQMALNVIDKYR